MMSQPQSGDSKQFFLRMILSVFYFICFCYFICFYKSVTYAQHIPRAGCFQTFVHVCTWKTLTITHVCFKVHKNTAFFALCIKLFAKIFYLDTYKIENCMHIVNFNAYIRPLVLSVYQNISFLISQPKHMLSAPKTYVKTDR